MRRKHNLKPRRIVNLDEDVYSHIAQLFDRKYDSPNAALRRMFGLPLLPRGPKNGVKYKKRKREKVLL